MRKFLAIFLAVLLGSWSVQSALAAGQGPAKPSIQVDKFASKPQQIAWLSYGLGLASFLQEHKLVDSLPAGVWEPSFDAEVFARQKQVTIWSELLQKQKLDYDFMEQMERVVNAGFLKEYVWHFYRKDRWTQPPALRLAEFNAWATANVPDHHAMSGAKVLIER